MRGKSPLRGCAKACLWHLSGHAPSNGSAAPFRKHEEQQERLLHDFLAEAALGAGRNALEQLDRQTAQSVLDAARNSARKWWSGSSR